MTSKISPANAAARKKLLNRITAAQKQADTAKKTAKLAKAGFKQAKQKFKEAKRAARKLRKICKALKTELAAHAVKKPARKPAAKPTVKHSRQLKVPAQAVIEIPAVGETPPATPTAGIPPA